MEFGEVGAAKEDDGRVCDRVGQVGLGGWK